MCGETDGSVYGGATQTAVGCSGALLAVTTYIILS